jgi:hypothetical protein
MTGVTESPRAHVPVVAASEPGGRLPFGLVILVIDVSRVPAAITLSSVGPWKLCPAG